LAREELSISVRYRALRVGELAYIQEAFISSSSRGIVPVVQVDEVPIGSSHPGVLTVRLMQAYKRGVLRQAETI
jgi:branched-subunit amino acid aminotransferase/4-amino-4-deoxychorismate lyase